jgi:predicted metal-dependent hydrolase
VNIHYRHQKRKSLAAKVTPDGLTVLLPKDLDADGKEVQAFVARALASLPSAAPPATSLDVAALQQLVTVWSERLGVAATRLQIRAMRNKWGSISTAGTLTLADDILALPYDLAEYVVVHELLHLKFPDHRQGWQVTMGFYLPDWRERERRLAGYVAEEKRT